MHPCLLHFKTVKTMVPPPPLNKFFPPTGWGSRRVRREVRPEAAARSGQTGGRTGQGNHEHPSDHLRLLIFIYLKIGNGEIQGNHRGAGADLRWDVWLLRPMSFINYTFMISTVPVPVNIFCWEATFISLNHVLFYTIPMMSLQMLIKTKRISKYFPSDWYDIYVFTARLR